MVPNGVQTAFGVQFGLGNAPEAQLNSKTSPIWDPKLDPKSTRKRSKIDLESDFETNSLSRPIWDRFSIDFRAVESKILIQIETLYLQSERDIRQKFFRSCVKTRYFWKKIGYHRWLKHVRTRWKLNMKRVMFDFSLACRCAMPFGTDFGTQNGRKIGPKVLQNRSQNGFERR